MWTYLWINKTKTTMSIIGGVGTAYVYSSFFNCIRMVSKVISSLNNYNTDNAFKMTYRFTRSSHRNIKATQRNLEMWPLWAVALYIQFNIILCICVLKGIEFAPFFLRCFVWILEWIQQWVDFCFSFPDFIYLEWFLYIDSNPSWCN
jgi:hypothetical protein